MFKPHSSIPITINSSQFHSSSHSFYISPLIRSSQLLIYSLSPVFMFTHLMPHASRTISFVTHDSHIHTLIYSISRLLFLKASLLIYSSLLLTLPKFLALNFYTPRHALAQTYSYLLTSSRGNQP